MASPFDVMELLLNTIWILAAAGAFVFWRPERHTATRAVRHDHRLLAVVALAGALLLLFPVISLTDDLHATQIAMEDSSSAITKTRDHGHRGLYPSQLPFRTMLGGAASSPRGLNLVFGMIVPPETRRFRAIVTRIFPDRSPPAGD